MLTRSYRTIMLTCCYRAGALQAFHSTSISLSHYHHAGILSFRIWANYTDVLLPCHITVGGDRVANGYR